MNALSGYRGRYAVAHRTWTEAVEAGLDALGNARDVQQRAAVTARRNAEALAAFRPVLEHTGALVSRARASLDQLPSSAPRRKWQAILDDLDHSSDQIHQILRAGHNPSAEVSADARDAALWPYLCSWGEHAMILQALVQQRDVQLRLNLTSDQSEQLLADVREARAQGRLRVMTSRHDMAGRRITTVELLDDDLGRTIAVQGDLDTPTLKVLGRYDDDLAAAAALPSPAPPGVLRPDGCDTHPAHSRVKRIESLTHEVLTSTSTGEVAEVLHFASSTQSPFRGPFAALRDLVDAANEFSHALGTRHGTEIAARLSAVHRQLHYLAGELREISDELDANPSVLPSHRVPRPHHLPAPRSDHGSQAQSAPGHEARQALTHTPLPARTTPGAAPPPTRIR
ncbi:hypothetical protein ACFY0R_10125 [Streptomyces sp. NPDC001633]|uniref:hypothetical protein n=1 Tax=Streptomyces sp. NPDC001633 TaxID=3364595 RepID=UPI0036A9F091